MQELPTIQPTFAPELSPEQIAEISEEVRALAQQRNAVILAHNYELPEIQDVANYLGDSLGLSRQAAETDAEVIAFCGVHFMAETASILSPQKTVLIPDLDAGCSLADSIDADQLRAWKAEHPGALVVMYVNTSAEVKAETDYCVTSSNAVDVVRHIWAEHGPETEILFGPDMWLGAFVERETGLVDEPERRGRFHIWDGECHVHAGIKPLDIARTRDEHPERRVPDPPRVRLLDPGDGVRRRRRHRPRGRPHALHLGDAAARRSPPRRRVHRRHRERDALPAAAGRPAGEPDRGQPDGLLQIHEDDHPAEAARLPAGDEVARSASRPRSPSGRGSRSSAWSRSASLVVIGPSCSSDRPAP